MNEQARIYDVYISACPEDAGWAEDWLRPRLEAAGLRVGTEADFDLGVARVVNVERAVIGSRSTLLVLTPAWVKSGWAEFEAVLTETHGIDQQEHQTLPLLLEPCQPPLRIAALTYADFTQAQRREARLQQVIAAARGDHNLKIVGATLSQFLDNRGRMLQKVYAFWIAGVLESALQGIAPLDLQLLTQPDAVPKAWEAVVQHATAAEQLPASVAIGDVFDRFEGALLILGEPGGGKTTLLLQLARELLARAEWNPGYAIPIVFNLSTWGRQRRPLAEWLVDELNAKYDVPRKLARAWAAEDQIIPLLDGLDEVEAPQRAACVEAINAYRQEHGFVRIAVCCRIADYGQLPQPLQLRGAVRVEPLTHAQVDSYLADAGEPLSGLRSAIEQDPALRDLALVPLTLGIMAEVYRSIPAAQLLGQTAAGDQQRRLFAAYVERMFARHGADAHYSHERTARWLAWLARGMQRQSQTVFLIERLQPSWLATRSARWRYVLLDRLGGGMLIGLSSGLIAALVIALVGLWFGGERGFGVGGILLGGLSAAVICGLAGALFGAALDAARAQRTARQIVAGALGGYVVVGIMSGVVHGLIYGAGRGLADGLVSGLAGALAGSLIGSAGVRPRQIAVVERLRWVGTKAARFAVVGLGAGLLGGALYGLIYGLVGQIAGDFPIWLSYGLTGAIVVGIIGGLVGGLAGDQIQTTAIPNQGIARSLQSAWRGGLIYGLAAGIVVGVIYGLVGGPQTLFHNLALAQAGADQLTTAPPGLIAKLSGGYVSGPGYGLMYGALYGLIAGLIAGLAYGGYAAISHLALRAVLWREGAAPWNYAAFLDYCVGRVFLRRVGGGYIFVHRLLLEYFATLPDQASTPAKADAPQRD